MNGPSAVREAQPESTEMRDRELLAASVNAVAPEFARALAGFFAASGADAEAAASAMEVAAAELRAGVAKLPAVSSYPWVQFGDAIALWWRDPEYLDQHGRPRPIPERGPAPSLEDLFARTVDPALWAAGKELLGRTVAVRTGDTWRYVKESAQLPLSGHECAERLLMTTVGMFTTFIDNQTRRADPLISKNTDSSAHVTMFPAHLIPELRAKIVKRAGGLLEDIDVWMTRQAEGHSEGPVSMVGVSVYVFTGEPRPRPGRAASASREDRETSAAPRVAAEAP